MEDSGGDRRDRCVAPCAECREKGCVTSVWRSGAGMREWIGGVVGGSTGGEPFESGVARCATQCRELKSENGLAYVPTNTWLGNRAYLSAVLIAHNTDARADDAHRRAGEDTDHQAITAVGLSTHRDGTSRNVAAGRTID